MRRYTVGHMTPQPAPIVLADIARDVVDSLLGSIGNILGLVAIVGLAIVAAPAVPDLLRNN